MSQQDQQDQQDSQLELPLAEQPAAPELPWSIDSKWVHRNGNKYTITGFANLHSTNPDYPAMVIYVGEDGRMWTRRVDDWLRSMTLDADAPAVATGDLAMSELTNQFNVAASGKPIAVVVAVSINTLATALHVADDRLLNTNVARVLTDMAKELNPLGSFVIAGAGAVPS